MTLRYYFSLYLLVLISLTIISCGGKTEAELIKETFKYYQDAILDNNGTAAASCLDQKTLEWYEKLLQMARETNKSQLEKTNYLSKFTVLALRQELDKATLEKMDARSAFAFAIEKSLYNQDVLKEYQVNNLKIESTRAIAALTKNGQTDEDHFVKFMKEDTGWKINFAAMINILNDDNTGRLIENIPGENDRAIKAVADLSDRSIKRNIWIPSNRWR